MTVAHVALDLCLGYQRGDGVYYDDINSPRTYQRLADVQRLLAVVRLTDVEFVDVYTQLRGIHWIQCMLSVDKGCRASQLLCLSYAVERQRSLTGRFRTVDLYDPSARESTDTKSVINKQTTGGDDIKLLPRIITQLHNRSLSKVLLYLAERYFQRLHTCFLASNGDYSPLGFFLLSCHV